MNSKKRKAKRLETKLHNALALPNRLRYVRLKRGMTLQELSSLVGVGANSISRYETGERTPSDITLLALCNALNVSPEYILKKTDDPSYHAYTKKLASEAGKTKKKELAQLNKLVERLSEEKASLFESQSGLSEDEALIANFTLFIFCDLLNNIVNNDVALSYLSTIIQTLNDHLNKSKTVSEEFILELQRLCFILKDDKDKF